MNKILIAEDDPVARDIVSSMVETIGQVAILSHNGRHAYETLQVNQDIKLLICDMMMPEMNGKDLVATLRATTTFADLPIIIISSIMGVNDIADLLDLGATLFQPKPINEDLLQKNIRLCLKQGTT
ncbi:MAG: response regulator [Desulfobulbaceae bacterium]|nr:response regulator [Desulfobulbaceae bacterium]